MEARETWKRFSTYYDSYVKDFTEDLAVYQKACGPHSRVLEIGCGSGRVLRHLLAMGHPVTGVDISEEMLSRSREKLRDYIDKNLLKLVNHDFQAGPLKGSFTVALISYFTFNYVLDHPERFLKHVHDSIFPHGSLMIDLFFPRTRHDPDVDGQWIKNSIMHEGKQMGVMEKRTWLEKKELEERVQIFDDGKSQHEVVTHRRYYSPKHVGDLLRGAGFKDLEFSAGYQGFWVDELPESQLNGNYMARALV